MKRVQYSDYVTECVNVFKMLSLPENKKDLVNMFHNESALFDSLLQDDLDSSVDTIMEKCWG